MPISILITKNNKMKNLIKWVKGFLNDAEGEPSSKRGIAFLTFALMAYSVYTGNVAMTQTLGGIILLALGITIPDRYAKK